MLTRGDLSPDAVDALPVNPPYAGKKIVVKPQNRTDWGRDGVTGDYYKWKSERGVSRKRLRLRAQRPAASDQQPKRRRLSATTIEPNRKKEISPAGLRCSVRRRKRAVAVKDTRDVREAIQDDDQNDIKETEDEEVITGETECVGGRERKSGRCGKL
ncbi:hypothetical protein BDV06DRAFT_161029 [Aspergillus oleicola]